MKQQNDVSSENNNTVLSEEKAEEKDGQEVEIKEEKEEEEDVNEEYTHDSSYKSCTKRILRSSKGTHCTQTENGKDFLEQSTSTNKSDEGFSSESPQSTCSSESEEDLWEPPRKIANAEKHLVKDFKRNPDQKGKNLSLLKSEKSFLFTRTNV